MGVQSAGKGNLLLPPEPVPGSHGYMPDTGHAHTLKTGKLLQCQAPDHAARVFFLRSSTTYNPTFHLVRNHHHAVMALAEGDTAHTELSTHQLLSARQTPGGRCRIPSTAFRISPSAAKPTHFKRGGCRLITWIRHPTDIP